MIATKSIIEEERVKKFKKTMNETYALRKNKPQIKPVSLRIPDESYQLIELLIQKGYIVNRSEFFRLAIEEKLALTIDDLLKRETFSNGKIY